MRVIMQAEKSWIGEVGDSEAEGRFGTSSTRNLGRGLAEMGIRIRSRITASSTPGGAIDLIAGTSW